MRRLLHSHQATRLAKRSGVALAIVLVLIGLFGILCQVLTMMVAIQHRQAFHQADQAQAHRLAEAALLHATAALERDSQWTGDTWKPTLPGGNSASVRLSIKKEVAKTRIVAEAAFTTSAGRIHKSNQTLDVPTASAREVSEGRTP
jgi:Tfp pilus assembly protein PilX